MECKKTVDERVKQTKADNTNKVRVSLYGLRKWVPKEDSVALKGTMEKVVVDSCHTHATHTPRTHATHTPDHDVAVI